MSILAILCFLIAIILFVIDAFWDVPRPKMLALGLAFFVAAVMAQSGFHL